MKRILIAVIILVGTIPFFDAATKIEWTTYLGIPLIIFYGSAAITFVTKRFEAIITGLILSAMWPVIIEIIRSTLITLK